MYPIKRSRNNTALLTQQLRIASAEDVAIETRRRRVSRGDDFVFARAPLQKLRPILFTNKHTEVQKKYYNFPKMYLHKYVK